jgi:hypothetical protein
MRKQCRQTGRREGSAESWEEFLAEDDEAKRSETLKWLNR